MFGWAWAVRVVDIGAFLLTRGGDTAAERHSQSRQSRSGGDLHQDRGVVDQGDHHTAAARAAAPWAPVARARATARSSAEVLTPRACSRRFSVRSGPSTAGEAVCEWLAGSLSTRRCETERHRHPGAARRRATSAFVSPAAPRRGSQAAGRAWRGDGSRVRLQQGGTEPPLRRRPHGQRRRLPWKRRSMAKPSRWVVAKSSVRPCNAARAAPAPQTAQPRSSPRPMGGVLSIWTPRPSGGSTASRLPAAWGRGCPAREAGRSGARVEVNGGLKAQGRSNAGCP